MDACGCADRRVAILNVAATRTAERGRGLAGAPQIMGSDAGQDTRGTDRR